MEQNAPYHKEHALPQTKSILKLNLYKFQQEEILSPKTFMPYCMFNGLKSSLFSPQAWRQKKPTNPNAILLACPNYNWKSPSRKKAIKGKKKKQKKQWKTGRMRIGRRKRVSNTFHTRTSFGWKKPKEIQIKQHLVIEVVKSSR